MHSVHGLDQSDLNSGELLCPTTLYLHPWAYWLHLLAIHCHCRSFALKLVTTSEPCLMRVHAPVSQWSTTAHSSMLMLPSTTVHGPNVITLELQGFAHSMAMYIYCHLLHISNQLRNIMLSTAFTSNNSVHLSNAVMVMLEDDDYHHSTEQCSFVCPNCDGDITIDEHQEMGLCSTCYGH